MASYESFTYIAHNQSGNRIVTGISKIAQVWDTVTFRPVGRPVLHELPIRGVSFCANDTRIFTKSGNAQAAVWHAETGERVGSVNFENPDPDGLTPILSYGPPTTRAVISFVEKTADIVDVAKSYESNWIGHLTHASGILDARCQLAGTRVVVSHYDSTAQIYDSATGEPIGPPLKAEGNNAPVLGFSPDGKRIVVWWRGLTTAMLLDTETGVALGGPLRHDSNDSMAAFSPDGRRIITQCHDRTARLWDATSLHPIGSPFSDAIAIYEPPFSLDGKLVVSANQNHTVFVMDARTALPIGPPLDHGGGVSCAAFNRSCTRIATGGASGRAQLWENVTGKQIGPPLDHGESISSVSFSADGTRIVTASYDNAKIWDAVTGHDLTGLFEDAPSV
jgi:WD40 repeat protein